jgi:hypothetical protein
MRRRWGVTEKHVQRRIKAFRIDATGRDYRPFLIVRDVPSLGRSAIVLGLITGRNHHWFSDLEYAHFVLLEYSPVIVDIREQYPLLPREETIEIARELGIRHPIYPGSHTPIVMTTDIVATVSGGGPGQAYLPMSIKYSSALSGKDGKSQRTMEKLLIEQLYWARRGWPLRLCTEKGIPMNRVRNLDMFRGSMAAFEHDHLNGVMQSFVGHFKAIWTQDCSLNDLLSAAANELELSTPETVALFGRSVWTRILPVDLDSHQIHYELPIRLLDVAAAPVVRPPDQPHVVHGYDLIPNQKDEALFRALSQSHRFGPGALRRRARRHV